MGLRASERGEMRRRAFTAGLASFAMPLGGRVSAGGQALTILTSFEPEFSAPFLAAFGALHPDVALRVVNRNSSQAVEELLAGNQRGFDLFWASSPEVFEILAQSDRLLPVGGAMFHDFALSAVGWAWRNSAVPEPPREWNDLLDARYRGRIVMAHPARSGTAHSLIESLLQDRGWEAGWRWLLQLAGQLTTISARSFSVLDDIIEGEGLIGLTIDYLALTREAQGLSFRYGRPLMIIPARVAALAGGTNGVGAAQFIAFLQSEAGQALLARPDIRRIPLDPQPSDGMTPELNAALRFSLSRYDPELAARRHWAIRELFEAFVSRDLMRRRAVWRRVDGIADGAARHRLQRLLAHMPISEAAAERAPQEAATLSAWSVRSRAILYQAEALLDAAEGG